MRTVVAGEHDQCVFGQAQRLYLASDGADVAVR